MAVLTYFTARLRYQAITTDEPVATGGDVNTDPETKGIYGRVDITPFIVNGDGVYADEIVYYGDNPARLVLATIRARLDNGQLKITADQADVRLVAQTTALALPGVSVLAYRFDFSYVTFNGGDQTLRSFAVEAPNTDIVLDLATAARIPL